MSILIVELPAYYQDGCLFVFLLFRGFDKLPAEAFIVESVFLLACCILNIVRLVTNTSSYRVIRVASCFSFASESVFPLSVFCGSSLSLLSGATELLPFPFEISPFGFVSSASVDGVLVNTEGAMLTA